MSVTFEQVARRVAELTATPAERLTRDTTIRELLPDSFAFIEVAVDLQEEYDVVLTQDDLEDLRTLGDLERLLAERHATAPAP
ncbi:acyl carrier protein [Amycolatopsis solani]|uniref:acyl carrier protein n=1 Tax=Amycolatopsis solani TaxID=3028615 RepID=UPI0025B24A25|nr:acyl carrier protein [Amycolatopsis sp. MEP2-6]